MISFGIDKKLIVLVLLVSISVLIIGAYLSFTYAEQILREKTQEQLQGESIIRGETIEGILNTRINEIIVLARNSIILDLVKQINQMPLDGNIVKQSEERFLAEIQEFQKIIGFSIGLEEIKIIGKEGIVYFSTIKINDNNFTNNSLFLRGLTETFIEFEPVNNKKRMVIVMPIYSDQRNMELIGVLITKMRTTEIDNIVSQKSGLGNTGEVYFVNKDFLMLSESRFIENAILKQNVTTLPVIECFENNREIIGLYKDYRDVVIFGSSYCSKEFVLLAEIDEKEIIEPILVLQDRILLTGMIILIIMSGIAFVLSKRISGPLIKLKNAANEIAQGNFSVRTEIKTNDEIGQLSSSFDAMAKKLQSSLHEIKLKENVIKQQEEILLNFSEESQNSCVCFIDLKNSTKITAKLSEQQTSILYGIFLNFMAEIIQKYNGIVVKNIGDALLFCFHKIEQNDLSAFENTIECCLKLVDSQDELNKKLHEKQLPNLDYKISSTYGSVRIAKISTSNVDDIFGSTVNRCAKINSVCPTNKIIVGENIYKILHDSEKYSFTKLENDKIDAEYGYTVYLVDRASS